MPHTLSSTEWRTRLDDEARSGLSMNKRWAECSIAMQLERNCVMFLLSNGARVVDIDAGGNNSMIYAARPREPDVAGYSGGLSARSGIAKRPGIISARAEQPLS